MRKAKSDLGSIAEEEQVRVSVDRSCTDTDSFAMYRLHRMRGR